MKKFNIDQIIVSIGIIIAFVVFMFMKPAATLAAVNSLFDVVADYFGAFMELFTFCTFVMSLYLIFGKYGKIKLGDQEPEYSLFSYISMMTMGAVASAAIFWSYTEWTYYYTAPGLGMIPGSGKALESALAYQFFHWGISHQAIFVPIAIAMAYAVYVKKVPALQTSAVCCAMMGEIKGRAAIGKVIDFVVIFGVVGALSCSVGLAVPMISGALAKVTGIDITFPVQVSIVGVIFLIFTFTSFIGTKKGMKNISTMSTGMMLSVLFYTLFAGPTVFILKNMVNSLGFMLEIFPRAAFFTDPVASSGFPEAWTIFFQAFYLNYAAMMGIFIAKVSKGRTIRGTICAVIFGITAGGWFLFGVNGSFSIHSHITGKSDVVAMATSGNAETGIYQVIALLPGGNLILPAVMFVIIIGFISSSLDAASLSLSQTTTKIMEKDGNVSRWMRVFWCVILTLVPLSIMFAKASFDALKMISIIVSVPFMFIIIFMGAKLLKWLKEDRKTDI